MGYVTVAELKAFTKTPDAGTTEEALLQYFLDSGEAAVSEYLAYDPPTASYTHTFFGDGKPYLQLRAKPVTLVSITVAGVARDVADFLVEDEVITEKNGVVIPVGSLVVVSYTGGHAVVPGVIKTVVLEIAALILAEAGGNIGVSGTSFDGGSTRTFVSYTNFSKYLAKLSRHRIRRLPRVAP